MPSGQKAGDLYLIISARRLSLFSFVLQQLLTLLFISRTQWLITAIYTLLLLGNSMTMAPPYLIYTLLVIRLFIHVPVVCYPLYAPKMGPIFFSAS